MTKPNSAATPPPKLEGWQHSEQVLAFVEHGSKRKDGRFLVAYYNHKPSFGPPCWLDPNSPMPIQPTWWWPLPPVV